MPVYRLPTFPTGRRSFFEGRRQSTTSNKLLPAYPQNIVIVIVIVIAIVKAIMSKLRTTEK